LLPFGKSKIIKELADWLAHPSEFGVAPKKVTLKKTYRVNFPGWGPQKVHLLEYEMPDGTRGRGFVGPLTWSFLGEGVDAVGDDRLVLAYAGWAWLTASLQRGLVQTAFAPGPGRAALLETLQRAGLEDVETTDAYRIGDSEVYEFRAWRDGVAVRGAGSGESSIVFEAGDPEYASLPAVYFYLGAQMA